MSDKNMVIPDGKAPKELLKRWRISKYKLANENQEILYYEDIAMYTAGAGIAAFVGMTALLWMIDIPVLPRPLDWIAGNISGGNYIQHLGYWAALIVHKATHFLFPDKSHHYLEYITKLSELGETYSNAVAIRILLGLLVAPFASFWGYKKSLTMRTSEVSITHDRGAIIHVGPDAEKILSAKFKKEVGTRFAEYAEFARISHNLFYSESRRRIHTILFGTSGSGKSQWLADQIRGSMKYCMRTVMFDPKHEFTGVFYDKNNPSHAILDFTCLHSHILDFFNDCQDMGMLKAVVAGMIPSEGDNTMWTDAARAVCTGLILFCIEKFRISPTETSATFTDLAQLLLMKNEDLAYAIFDTYPQAAKLVGELKASGEVESNVTTSGIMINMMARMDMINTLASYWYDNTKKKISLKRFMSDPDYEIKVLFIYPNAAESKDAYQFSAMVLSYLISFVDMPNILKSSTKPIGTFIFDEAHQPGKLTTPDNKPIFDKLFDRGRSYGWACYLAVQDINQLWKIYSEHDVNGWLGTVNNFVCTGANAELIQRICDNLGERDILKYAPSETEQSDSKSRTNTWQKHNEKVLLTAQFEKLMERDDSVGIKFYYKPSGVADGFILEKPWVDLEELASNVHVVQPRLRQILYDKNSRACLAIQQIKDKKMNDAELEQELSAERKLDLMRAKQNNTIPVTTNYDPSSEPSDDELDAASLARNLESNKIIYNITEFDDDDELAIDLGKDMGIEMMMDSHSISTVLSLAQHLSTPYKNLTTDRNKYLQAKNEKLKGRFERAQTLELSQKKES